jgi:DNA-binding NtrC family response regulator
MVPDLPSGISLLQRESIDLILTDLFVDTFSPNALAELAALTRAAPATPVVLATAHARAAAYDPAQYGLTAILLKPFAARDLRDLVRRILAEQRLQVQPQGEGQAREISATPCPILVADDDPYILATAQIVLENEGYAVDTARNGQEALDRVAVFHPHVLLLDMRMPVLDGWAVAQALRDRRDPVRVLIMTAARDVQRSAEEVQADGYLAKPFDLGELLHQVERLCAP